MKRTVQMLKISFVSSSSRSTFNFHRPQTKFAKVMFLHLSVSHSVHGGGVSTPVHAWIHTSPRTRGSLPRSRHPPEGDTPLGADPPEHTPPRSRHPPAQCICMHYGYVILCRVILWNTFLFFLHLPKRWIFLQNNLKHKTYSSPVLDRRNYYNCHTPLLHVCCLIRLNMQISRKSLVKFLYSRLIAKCVVSMRYKNIRIEIVKNNVE